MAPKPPVELTQEDLSKGCEELRYRFFKELKEDSTDYTEADVNRLREDDEYCQRFIHHQKGNLDDALQMVKESLKWRKDFGVHDIKESNLLMEFFEINGIFPYSVDKLGNENLILMVCLNRKDAEIQDELRRFIVYWLEKLEKRCNGKKINVIFNCTAAGLSHLDLDMIRFLINAFKYYYPWFLENILVYDMPWIFAAAWRLIKTWLPEDDVERIKFVTKKNIFDYIDPDKLPMSMGGTGASKEAYIPVFSKTCNNSLSISLNPPKK